MSIPDGNTKTSSRDVLAALASYDNLVRRAVDFLNREKSLKLGESPWRCYTDDDDLFKVDWERLFPESRRSSDNGADPWNLEELHENELVQAIHRRLDGGSQSTYPQPGALCPVTQGNWDVFAWYQPIHFFGYDWGIFIREDGIFSIACSVLNYLQITNSPMGPKEIVALYKSLVRAAFLVLYLHEQYHHKVESLGFRIHIAHLTSAYVPYKKNVYRPSKGTDDLLEEALANADSFLRLKTDPYKRWIPAPVLDATQQWMKDSFPKDPPGYRKAVHYISAKSFSGGENLLQAQVRDAKLVPGLPVEDWDLAPRMTQSMFPIRSNIWTVVSRGARPVVPVAAHPSSWSFTDVNGHLARRGYSRVPDQPVGQIRLRKEGYPDILLPAGRQAFTSGSLQNMFFTIGAEPGSQPSESPLGTVRL